MKKLIALVVLATMLLGGIAFATPNFPREDQNKAGFSNIGAVYVGTDAVVVARPALVYGIEVYADAANSHCDLYNTAAAPANGVKPKIEVGEATQFRTTHHTFETPLNFDTGIYVDQTSGTCFVEYR